MSKNCEMCGISNDFFKDHYNLYEFGLCEYTTKNICVLCFTKLQKQDKDFQEWSKELSLQQKKNRESNYSAKSSTGKECGLMDTKSQYQIEKKYTRPPTVSELIEAFPDECRYQVKIKLPEVKHELEPFYNFIKRVQFSDLNLEAKNFWIKVCEVIYMPKEKIQHYKNLQIMQRLMCKTTRGINNDDIQRAKDVDIFSLYDFNKRKRNTACCPFHQDGTPSFSVRGNRWVCFSGCGKGDSIDFYMKLNKVPFYKAVEELNKLL